MQATAYPTQDLRQGPAGPGQPLSPPQRQAFDLVVQQALGLLLQGTTARHIVQKAAAGDPEQAVVDAVAPLLQRIYATARAAGAQLDTVTLLAAGINIVAVVADMLAQAGILRRADIPAFCRSVAQMAVQQHNRQAGQGAGQGGAPAEGMPPAPGASMGAM